jgi:hypothetical protein
MKEKVTIYELLNKSKVLDIHQPIEKPYSVKARLAILGKRQTDLITELNRLGGRYRISSASYLSDVLNGRQSGEKAQLVNDKCMQILKVWETEASQ